jgi:tryptophan synthase alpha subunit
VGFGISNAQQFAEVGRFADGGAVGSAIVQTIEQNPGREAQAVEDFVRGLKSGARGAATSQN